MCRTSGLHCSMTVRCLSPIVHVAYGQLQYASSSFSSVFFLILFGLLSFLLPSPFPSSSSFFFLCVLFLLPPLLSPSTISSAFRRSDTWYVWMDQTHTSLTLDGHGSGNRNCNHSLLLDVFSPCYGISSWLFLDFFVKWYFYP